MENVPSLFSTKHRLTSSDTARRTVLMGQSHEILKDPLMLKGLRIGIVEKTSIAKGSHVVHL
jgi:hypothetical protein